MLNNDSQLQNVIQEQTASGESSVIQDGPTPRHTANVARKGASPIHLSFS